MEIIKNALSYSLIGKRAFNVSRLKSHVSTSHCLDFSKSHPITPAPGYLSFRFDEP